MVGRLLSFWNGAFLLEWPIFRCDLLVSGRVKYFSTFFFRTEVPFLGVFVRVFLKHPDSLKMDAFFLVPFPGFKNHTCQFFVGFRMEKVWGAKDWKTEDVWIFWTRNLYKRFLLSPTCPEVPKMEDFLNHMFGFFGRWVYPYRIQPIGEDSSILGTWNVWWYWGQFPFPPAPVRTVQGKKGITKTKQMMRTLWLLLWRRYLTKRYLTLPKFNIPQNFHHFMQPFQHPPPPKKKATTTKTGSTKILESQFLSEKTSCQVIQSDQTSFPIVGGHL